MENLSHFKFNSYSQFGEDGIIGEILKRILKFSPVNSWCVEFGAWDGIKFSNTCKLIREQNYSAVLIESKLDRARQIKANFPQENVYAICEFVTLDAPNNLDSILKSTPCPKDLDLISIDIDGCEYHILESLQKYEPKIICVEFNPTIPNEIIYIQPRNFKIKRGSSARAIVELCENKNYTLAAVTYTNLLFVHNSYAAHVLGTQSNQLNDLRDDSEFKTFIFSGIDGEVLSNKQEFKLGWHLRELSIPISDLNILPKYLRNFPDDYNYIQKFLYKLYIFLNLDSKSRIYKIISYVRNHLNFN